MRRPLLFPPDVGAIAAVAACAMLVAACGNGGDASRSVTLSECRLPKMATAAQCGTIEVPENRDQPDGRRISIAFAVLPANTLAPKPDALLLLPGGPGQSGDALVPFASRLGEVRRTRDLVLIDPRGSGRSAPLHCPALEPEDAEDAMLDADPVPAAARCAKELAAEGVDASQYTTANWVADVEAVRAALGYPQWNVWGGSYGTRVALEYARRHPARVRTMVLDGVAPPSLRISLGVWETRDRALDQLFEACGTSKACSAAHPDLAASLRAIRDALGPTGRVVAFVDPRTGDREERRLTFDVVLASLQALLYLPELSSVVPALLGSAASGDFGPLMAAAMLISGDIAKQTSGALHYSVTCAEDVPRITPQDLKRLEGRYVEPLARRVFAVCDVWPRGRQPADATTPVVSAIPTLLVSGGLDPVTPPQYAEEVAKTLSNHRH
ncbi:MAG TPA: alpha/beta fold hydrolase, partial [Casimicrobiaceae bacterium]|nr:alpha/beta fold hydrolase [Casimicrobiaceae bacterium]